jgi:hypothetical protein
MTSHDSHSSHHPAATAALALCGIVVATVLALMTVAACVNGKLAPATATALEAGLALACPEEAAIPVAGPFLVAACPGQEALLAAVVARVSAQPAALVLAPSAAPPDAGAVVVARKVPLVVVDSTGRLIHCGYAEPAAAQAIQRALTPAPAVSASAPPPPPTADGGK